MLSGGHSIGQAKLNHRDVDELLRSGYFPLRKWIANDSQILEDVPVEHLAEDIKSLSDPSTTTFVLGLSSSHNSDQFHFKVQVLDPPSKYTERIVLSRTAKIFDPMVWLFPITVVGKVFMQNLWLTKLNWDDELTIEWQNVWRNWEAQLPFINGITIPRWNCYKPQAEVIQLHVFSDASKSAYGSAGYLRIISNSEVFVSLQSSKSKVAPLELLSIRRLELAAMHLFSKIARHFIKESKFKYTSVHLWTDSMDVLFWLQSQPSRWITFVANQCSSILENCPVVSFYHSKSKENPADIV